MRLKQKMESQVQVLLRLMEEEISHYEELVKELKKETDYLRRGSPEDLLGSVKAVAPHVEAIQQIHQSIRKKIAEVLNITGQEKTLVELMALLPPRDSQKLRKYQGTLDKLKEWVMQINSRNKAFIQDSLAYGRDLFSLLTPSTAAAPVYVQNGKKRPPAQQPLSVDRKV
jgi:flagellar biosynthesis/type III secretory pathway chaperone